MGENWQVRDEYELNEIVDASSSNFKLLQDPTKLSEKALLFKALGDETRIKIIGLLSGSDMCMCEITTALQSASSTISHHLKQLEAGKVINSRKEGKFTIYSLNKNLVTPYIID